MKEETMLENVRIPWNEIEIMYLQNDRDLVNIFTKSKDKGI